MLLSPKLFISYRRTQLDAVRPAVEALRAEGVECFLDLEDIDPLADFPDRICEGIDLDSAPGLRRSDIISSYVRLVLESKMRLSARIQKMGFNGPSDPSNTRQLRKAALEAVSNF